MNEIMYITHDGVTDHIGRSQVAPYLLQLAAMGFKINIVSAEKTGREQLIEHYRRLFADHGIDWSFVTYHNRPPLMSTAFDLYKMYKLADRIASERKIGMIHCRSHLAMVIGSRLKAKLGCKLLFDFRHFYVEGGLAHKRFKFVYRLIGKLEGSFFSAADHIVCLTNKAVDVLDDRYPSTAGKSRFQVIPCCADFDHFTPDLSPADVGEARAKLRISEGDTVLLYLGSLGPAYLLDQMLKLFQELLDVRADAKFVFLVNNGEDELRAAFTACGISPDTLRVRSETRETIPSYLALADVSVIFIRPDLSHAGCSPTKLAELLAQNVPVIANAGVGDLEELLSFERNRSVVVRDFEPETLRAAVEKVLSATHAERLQIREASRGLSLEEGSRRYASVYRTLLEQDSPPSPHMQAV